MQTLPTVTRRVCILAILFLSVVAGLREPLGAADSSPAVGLRRNNAFNSTVWPADFNGDGITDLVAHDQYVNRPPDALVVLGRGDGTYGTPFRLFMSRVLAVGDFNNDGKTDVLVEELPAPESYIYVLAGRGDGTFEHGDVQKSAWYGTAVSFGIAADMNNDGNLDVVLGETAAGYEYVAVVPGNGDLSFDLEATTVLPAAAYPHDATVADLNGDGRKDLAVANHDGHSVSIFLNQGNFSFTAAEIGFDRQANDVAAADLNRDGRMDLVVATSRDANDDYNYTDGYANVLFGNGNGSFQTPVAYETARGAWQTVIGDFTHDGIPDIATANRSSIYVEDNCGPLLRTWDSLSILPGRSDGTFGAASSFSPHNQADLDDTRFTNSVLSLNAADVDGDGAQDLIASWGAILTSQPSNPNWPPTVDLSQSRTDGTTVYLRARAADVDHDLLTYRWSSTDGQPIPPVPSACVPATPGTHTYTVTVDDGHGHQATDSVTLTVGGSITISSPAAGEVVAGGTPYTIRWTSDGSADWEEVIAHFSTDRGVTSTFIPECTYVQVSVGRCTWSPPDLTTDWARITLDGREGFNSGVSGIFSIRATGSTPFTGTPIGLPAKIEAENYDNGGEGVAYHDTTPGNNTGLYRRDDVDLQTAQDAGGGYKVKTAVASEWLQYTVDAPATANYAIDVRVSSNGGGGMFHIDADGVNVTGPMAVPNTSGWESWRTVSSRTFTLAAGLHKLRLVLDTNGATGLTGNFNWMFVKAAPTSTPFPGSGVALPGKIEAENYDRGGEGVAYHDTTPGNNTGLYRTDDVDLQTASDTGGGYKVKTAVATEWLKYTVEIAPGTYAIDVRVTSNGGGGTFHIEVDGVDKTGPMTVPNTGSWESWRTVTKTGVALPAGRHIISLVMDTNGTSGLTGNFNWIAVRGGVN